MIADDTGCFLFFFLFIKQKESHLINLPIDGKAYTAQRKFDTSKRRPFGMSKLTPTPTKCLVNHY